MTRADSTDEGLFEDLFSGDETRAAQALEAIGDRHQTLLPRLLEYSCSPDADERWWAVAALARLEDERARQALAEALEDPSAEVRQCAALGLRMQPDPRAIPQLIHALSSDDRMLARLAGDALAACGAQALEPLTQTLREGSPAARIEAARALALCGDENAIAPLFAALDDPSTMVAHWAREGLERMGIGMVFFKP